MTLLEEADVSVPVDEEAACVGGAPDPRWGDAHADHESRDSVYQALTTQ